MDPDWVEVFPVWTRGFSSHRYVRLLETFRVPKLHCKGVSPPRLLENGKMTGWKIHIEWVDVWILLGNFSNVILFLSLFVYFNSLRPANDVALIGELCGVVITMMKCDVKDFVFSTEAMDLKEVHCFWGSLNGPIFLREIKHASNSESFRLVII